MYVYRERSGRAKMAYAAVISLKHTIKRLVRLPKSRILLPDSETELIYQDLRYLESFLQTLSSRQNGKRVNNLESRIKDVAHNFEDLIESHISDRFLSSEYESSGDDEGLTFVLSQVLLKVKQELSSFTKALKAEEAAEYDTEDQKPSSSFAADVVSPGIDSGEMIEMVGMGDTLKDLRLWLLEKSKYHYTSYLQVRAVVGMAGIGKTTIAQLLYHDPVVCNYFHPRLFMRIGPIVQLKEVLLLALDHLGFLADDIILDKDCNGLGSHLRHFLASRRYLIVLDDVWDAQVLNELEHFFPDDICGSRIILTTRQLGIAAPHSWHICDDCQVPLLNDEDSWKLLHRTVFTNGESCNHQLEKIGREIATNCEGLPLLIVEVGKLLCKTEKTVKNWEIVAEDENPLNIRAGDDTPISITLTLSYDLLPLYLKACFLYVGVFQKKYAISPSKLVNLWMCEGFLEPQRSVSLEITAKECLDDLVSRSLVLVHKRSSYRGIKTCGVHLAFRKIAVSQAWDESFFHVINKYADNFQDGTSSQRRLCIHNKTVLAFKKVLSLMESVSGASSLVCFGQQDQRPLRMYLRFRVLRVLDALTIRFYEFPHEVVKLVQLRYLAITYDGEIPASISRLWNLEVLILHRHHFISSKAAPVCHLPIGIWKLNRLRHLECVGFDLPDPPADFDSHIILEELLTLSGVSARSCTWGILARMPNLTKLGVRSEPSHDADETFSFFGDIADLCGRIESFKCVVVSPHASQVAVSSIPLAFPVGIRKITLSGCGFSWESTTCIGRLPDLRVLKLRCYAFRGPEWKTTEGEFRNLRFLLLEDLDIEHWTIGSGHFRGLQSMAIRHCYKLQKMPITVPNFPCLEMLELDDCSPSANGQVREELEKVIELGFELQIHSSWEAIKL